MPYKSPYAKPAAVTPAQGLRSRIAGPTKRAKKPATPSVTLGGTIGAIKNRKKLLDSL